MTYRHILVAVDLAPYSKQVLQQASQLAKTYQASLDVIHVIENAPLVYGGEFSIPLDVNLEQTLEKEARRILQTLCQPFSIAEKNQHVIPGVVKHTVMEFVKKLNIDLIMVGTHGHHGIDKLLGSRANAILHAATCDVLAVRVKE